MEATEETLHDSGKPLVSPSSEPASNFQLHFLHTESFLATNVLPSLLQTLGRHVLGNMLQASSWGKSWLVSYHKPSPWIHLFHSVCLDVTKLAILGLQHHLCPNFCVPPWFLALLHLAFNAHMVLGLWLEESITQLRPQSWVYALKLPFPLPTLFFPPHHSPYLYYGHGLRPFFHRWTLGGISNACLDKYFPVKLTFPSPKTIKMFFFKDTQYWINALSETEQNHCILSPPFLRTSVWIVKWLNHTPFSLINGKLAINCRGVTSSFPNTAANALCWDHFRFLRMKGEISVELTPLWTVPGVTPYRDRLFWRENWLQLKLFPCSGCRFPYSMVDVAANFERVDTKTFSLSLSLFHLKNKSKMHIYLGSPVYLMHSSS